MANSNSGGSGSSSYVEGVGKPVAFDVGGNPRSILDLDDIASGDDNTFDGADNDESDGDLSGSDSIVDPSSIGANGDAPFGRFPDGRPRKRRPKGSGGSDATKQRTGTGGRKATSQVSTDLAEMLAMLHFGIATVAKAPELQLTEDEANKLAKSITRVTELYEVPLMDEKTRAWIGLTIAAGTIYGPKFIAMKLGAKNKRPQPQNVVNMGMRDVG